MLKNCQSKLYKKDYAQMQLPGHLSNKLFTYNAKAINKIMVFL